MTILFASSAASDLYPLPTVSPGAPFQKASAPYVIDSTWPSSSEAIDLSMFQSSSNTLWLTFTAIVTSTISSDSFLFYFSTRGNTYSTFCVKFQYGRLRFGQFNAATGVVTDVGDTSPILTGSLATRFDIRINQDGLNPISVVMYANGAEVTSGTFSGTTAISRLNFLRFGSSISGANYVPRISQIILSEEDTRNMFMVQLQPQSVEAPDFTGGVPDITVTGSLPAMDASSLTTIKSSGAVLTGFNGLPAGLNTAEYDVLAVGLSYRAKVGRDAQNFQPLVSIGEDSSPFGVPQATTGIRPYTDIMNVNPINNGSWDWASATDAKLGLLLK